MKSLPSLSLLGCVIVAWLFLFACTQPVRTSPPPIGFHQIRLLDLHNADVDFYALRGKIVLLDIFASHCMPCQYFAKRWDKLARQHSAKGLRVVGIALDTQAKQVLLPFLQALDIRYPVVIADDTITKGRTILGPVLTVPRQYLLDGCGKIRHIFQGMIPPKQVEDATLALLKETPSCSPTK
jgi:thiol-disulfide isomerase/thioredoxin